MDTLDLQFVSPATNTDKVRFILLFNILKTQRNRKRKEEVDTEHLYFDDFQDEYEEEEQRNQIGKRASMGVLRINKAINK